jgi:hypothetical protein
VPPEDRRLQQRRKRRIALRRPVSVVVLTPHMPLELPLDPPDVGAVLDGRHAMAASTSTSSASTSISSLSYYRTSS